MLESIALLALLASATADAFPPLGIAEPSEAVSAVDSCLKAAAPGKIDETRLAAEGWQEQPGVWPNAHIFTRQGNGAVVITMDAPLAGTCYVRVRLANDASIEAVGEAIDRQFGVIGKRRTGEAGKFFWRKDNAFVGSEGFDDGPGYPPHVIQIAVGELPKEIR